MNPSEVNNKNISAEILDRKKQYTKPFLSHLGSVTTLTLGGGSPCLDGASSNSSHDPTGNSCKEEPIY